MPADSQTQVGANALVAFLSFFSAFFSFMVLAGFFFCPLLGPYLRISSSSTSNTSEAPGGMTLPAPLAP